MPRRLPASLSEPDDRSQDGRAGPDFIRRPGYGLERRRIVSMRGALLVLILIVLIVGIYARELQPIDAGRALGLDDTPGRLTGFLQQIPGKLVGMRHDPA